MSNRPTPFSLASEWLAVAEREERPLIMGIFNATPDSFFDGGMHATDAAVRARISALVGEGAELLDIGGESTRPGHEVVDTGTQIARITPALRHASEISVPSEIDAADDTTPSVPLVSVDTTDPAVARFALGQGAHVINDVSCLEDVELARVVAEFGGILILAHSRGRNAQRRGNWPDSDYGDVVSEVADEWRRARDRAVAVGLDSNRVWFDPGIGFAKNARHNFAILHALEEFHALGAPLLVGPSRKSFIGAVSTAPVGERLPGTIAACLRAADAGARVLRVHDVAAVRQAVRVGCAIRRPEKLLRLADVERRHRISEAERVGPARP